MKKKICSICLVSLAMLAFAPLNTCAKALEDSLSNGVQSLFDSSLFDSTCSSICEENESVISSSPDVKSSESFSKKSDIPVLEVSGIEADMTYKEAYLGLVFSPLIPTFFPLMTI